MNDALARSRFFTLLTLRLVGIVLMVVGMLVWHTDLIRPGGWWLVGVPVFAIGFAESTLLPRFLAKRWRSPQDL